MASLALERMTILQERSFRKAPISAIADWVTEAEVRDALLSLDPLWDELFPAEQARIVQLLVERVEIHPDGLDLRLRVEGLQTLVADLRAGQTKLRAA